MSDFGVHVYEIRPSGHRVTVWKGEFGCKNATNHKKDIIEFLDQLKDSCPVCMKELEK